MPRSKTKVLLVLTLGIAFIASASAQLIVNQEENIDYAGEPAISPNGGFAFGNDGGQLDESFQRNRSDGSNIEVFYDALTADYSTNYLVDADETNGNVHLYDRNNINGFQSWSQSTPASVSPPFNIQISPDGEYVAWGESNGDWQVRDISTWTQQVSGSMGSGADVSWSSSGDTLLVGGIGYQATYNTYDSTNSFSIINSRSTSLTANSWELSPDATEIVMGAGTYQTSNTERLTVYEASTGNIQDQESFADAIYDVEWHPTVDTIGVYESGGTLSMLNEDNAYNAYYTDTLGSSASNDVGLEFADNGGYMIAGRGQVYTTTAPEAPEADFTVDGEVYSRTGFDGLEDNSTETTDSIDTWDWDIDGDGNYEYINQYPEDAVFYREGNIDVTLRVTDTEGRSDTVTKTVDVETPPSIAVDQDENRYYSRTNTLYKRNSSGGIEWSHSFGSTPTDIHIDEGDNGILFRTEDSVYRYTKDGTEEENITGITGLRKLDYDDDEIIYVFQDTDTTVGTYDPFLNSQNTYTLTDVDKVIDIDNTGTSEAIAYFKSGASNPEMVVEQFDSALGSQEWNYSIDSSYFIQNSPPYKMEFETDEDSHFLIAKDTYWEIPRQPIDGSDTEYALNGTIDTTGGFLNEPYWALVNNATWNKFETENGQLADQPMSATHDQQTNERIFDVAYHRGYAYSVTNWADYKDQYLVDNEANASIVEVVTPENATARSTIFPEIEVADGDLTERVKVGSENITIQRYPDIFSAGWTVPENIGNQTITVESYDVLGNQDDTATFELEILELEDTDLEQPSQVPRWAIVLVGLAFLGFFLIYLKLRGSRDDNIQVIHSG